MTQVTEHRRNVGYAVMRLIRAYEIDTVFGIPGTHNLEFYRHLDKLGIHCVTTRHEQGAGYGADGWSQRTGKPGVVITTSGPGLLNVLSAVGTSFAESRPLLVLAPGVSRGEGFADNGTLHETKDQLAAAAAIAGPSTRAESLDDALEAVHTAFAAFAAGRPRPHYLEIPLDLLEEEVSASEAEAVAARTFPAVTLPAEGDLDRAATMLAVASKPVILAGGGATAAQADLTVLAERLSAPVATTINGKGALSETHPLSLGSDLRFASAREAVESSDVVLVAGSKVGVSELWEAGLNPAGAVIRIDVEESQLNKNLAADIALLGRVEAVLPELLKRVDTESPAKPWLDVLAVREQIDREAVGLAPAEMALAQRLAAVIPEDAVVAGDSSQITYYGMTTSVKHSGPKRFLYTPAYATLGYGLPAAIGAKIADPERPVVCVLGDGALMFALQEFQTAADQQANVVVVCVDNGGYEEIKQNEADRGITPTGVVLGQPDWKMLIEAFGGTSFGLTDEKDLESTMEQALAATGLVLVHVPMDLFR